MEHIGYHHALVFTQLLPETEQALIERIHAVRRGWPEIQLSLLHVVHPIPVTSFQGVSIVNIQDQLMEEATRKIAQLGRRMAIPTWNQRVLAGSPVGEVLRMAEQLEVDLIITDDDQESLLPSFFGGSTLSRLIHRAPCNVLCVH